MFREWFQIHGHEVIVGAIMAAIGIGITLAVGGDPLAEAGRHRR